MTIEGGVLGFVQVFTSCKEKKSQCNAGVTPLLLLVEQGGGHLVPLEVWRNSSDFLAPWASKCDLTAEVRSTTNTETKGRETALE